MKNRFFAFLGMIALFASCNSPEFQPELDAIVSVERIGVGQIDYRTNYGHLLRQYAAQSGPLEIGDRLSIVFAPLSDFKDDGSEKYTEISMKRVEKILTYSIIDLPEGEADTLGSDPFDVINKIDIANHHMDLIFTISIGESTKIKHDISLVKLTSPAVQRHPDTVFLELRHKARNDFRTKIYSDLVSFKIDDLKVAGKNSIVLAIKAKSEAEGRERYFYRKYDWTKPYIEDEKK